MTQSHVHKRTDPRRQNGDNRGVHMMLIIAALVLVTGIVSVLRVSRRGAAVDRGWMSEKWLAEHRSTPPS